MTKSENGMIIGKYNKNSDFGIFVDEMEKI
jgi:hypothetical protein